MGKAELTRNIIIEKAAPIFNMNGYAGTSISDLAEALGMTKGAIYGNFSNKDEIALEAFLYNFARISDSISAEIKKHDNSCDKLIAFALFYRENYENIAVRGGCPLLNGAVDSDDGHPALRKKVRGKLDFWKNNLAAIVRRGKKRGEIRERVDEVSFSTLFIALIEGGIMMSKITDDIAPLAGAVNHIIDMVNGDLRKR